MQLEHKFEVDAPTDEVWQALQEPERVAPCMPGTTLLGVDGDTLTAQVKVKLGPVTMQYKGAGEFVEKDESAHKLVISASGKDVRGAGTASTTATVTLSGDGARTTGTVVGDVHVTGRPAQFGQGMISEVSGRLLAEFAANLAEELAPKEATESGNAGGGAGIGVAPEATTTGSACETVRAPERDAINLVGVAGTPALKRVAWITAVVVVLVVIWVAARSWRH